MAVSRSYQCCQKLWCGSDYLSVFLIVTNLTKPSPLVFPLVCLPAAVRRAMPTAWPCRSCCSSAPPHPSSCSLMTRPCGAAHACGVGARAMAPPPAAAASRGGRSTPGGNSARLMGQQLTQQQRQQQRRLGRQRARHNQQQLGSRGAVEGQQQMPSHACGFCLGLLLLPLLLLLRPPLLLVQGRQRQLPTVYSQQQTPSRTSSSSSSQGQRRTWSMLALARQTAAWGLKGAARVAGTGGWGSHGAVHMGVMLLSQLCGRLCWWSIVVGCMACALH